MPICDAFRPRIAAKLQRLYGRKSIQVLARLDDVIDRLGPAVMPRDGSLYGPQTVMMITYGDQVQCSGRPSLQVLNGFMHEYGLEKVISGIHILPCFPYSSDDGFSVIDYGQIDPALGDWDDIDSLARSFGLMFDFVINHCSKEHAWFQAYLRREAPYTDYFIEADPEADLSAVVRPRSLPLLTDFETADGTRHVWTTFSDDQVDLNFSNPDVLLAMIEILLLYLTHGAKAIRLDAIGFLWKELGSNCMHLPEAHTVVKLLRDVVDVVAPGTVMITETNVPHDMNVSYFGGGDGDEAHAVYNFSLPPLLLDAFLTADAGPLTRWLGTLEYPGIGMTFFNFTASHDGIGVRPLEGLVPPERIAALADSVRERGGHVNTRRQADGTDAAYELNITYFSALGDPAGLSPELHARKFLTSQGVMLALRGVPGIYFHSLIGTPNYEEGVASTGQNRTINRRKFGIDELRTILADEGSAQSMVFVGYRNLLETHSAQPAFHPDAAQEPLESGHPSVLVLLRTSLDETQRVLVLANLANETIGVAATVGGRYRPVCELLSTQPVSGSEYELAPYGLAWITLV